MHKPAVFLDRDGVLNHLVDDHAPLSVERFALFRHAPSFVRELNDRGYLVLVVTEQPDRARGRLSPMGVSRIHARLNDEIAAGGGRIDGIHVCEHDADADPAVAGGLNIACRCKRPAPGLILRAAQQHRVDLTRSFLVCRTLSDVKAGRSAALETILLTDSHMQDIEVPPDLRPHHVAPDLVAVLRSIDAVRQVEGVR